MKNIDEKILMTEEEIEQRNSHLFTRAHIYTLTGACVFRRLLAEVISANADTGELHSPTEINFLF